MLSCERFLLKRKKPRFSADFTYLLSYERPFKFPRYLAKVLGIDRIIAMSHINIHSAVFKLTRLGNGNGHGNRNGN
jgi:hypothetical protein